MYSSDTSMSRPYLRRYAASNAAAPEASVSKVLAEKQSAEKALTDKNASDKVEADLRAKQAADKKEEDRRRENSRHYPNGPPAEFTDAGDGEAGSSRATARWVFRRSSRWRLECTFSAVPIDVQ
jgi:hypothetical protein